MIKYSSLNNAGISRQSLQGLSFSKDFHTLFDYKLGLLGSALEDIQIVKESGFLIVMEQVPFNSRSYSLYIHPGKGT